MKKIIILLLIVFPILSFAQEKVTWDYPVKPGSEEWRFTSYAEKLQKNQPPLSLMDKLTTPQLFDLCINYPFNMDIFLFNNPNNGIRKVLNESSCWQEFIKRKDGVKTLIKIYDQTPISKIVSINDKHDRSRLIIDTYIIEKIISESTLIKNSDLKNQKVLLKSLMKKHDEKKEFPKKYYGYTYYSTISAILKILENQNEISSKISENIDYYNLVERGINNNKELEQEILTIAKNITDI